MPELAESYRVDAPPHTLWPKRIEANIQTILGNKQKIEGEKEYKEGHGQQLTRRRAEYQLSRLDNGEVRVEMSVYVPENILDETSKLSKLAKEFDFTLNSQGDGISVAKYLTSSKN